MIQKFQVSEIRRVTKPQKVSSILIQNRIGTYDKLRIIFLNDSCQGLKIFFGLTANFVKWRPSVSSYYVT